MSDYYVSVYIDPRNHEEFYYGKGKVGIPDHRDRSFRAIVTADSDAS